MRSPCSAVSDLKKSDIRANVPDNYFRFTVTVPARFTGRIDGNTVTITATVNDTVAKQTVVKGPVTVVFGAEAKLGPCPICRRQVVTGATMGR